MWDVRVDSLEKVCLQLRALDAKRRERESLSSRERKGERQPGRDQAAPRPHVKPGGGSLNNTRCGPTIRSLCSLSLADII